MRHARGGVEEDRPKSDYDLKQMGYIDPKLVEGAAALVESFTCAICFNLFEMILFYR